VGVRVRAGLAGASAAAGARGIGSPLCTVAHPDRAPATIAPYARFRSLLFSVMGIYVLKTV